MPISNAPNITQNQKEQFLFRRAYSLALGQPRQTSALQYSNFVQATQNGTVQPPSGLKISFDINKNSVGSSNKSTIKIWNMAKANRNKIDAGWVLRLQAGYNGIVDTIFFGNIRENGIRSDRQGADIVTTMECGDGEGAIVMSRLDKNYPPGSTLAQIITDIGNAMSAQTAFNPAGLNAGTILGIPNVTYARGIPVSGPCAVTLDKLLKPAGLRWNVQNGNLNIMPLKAFNGQSAIVVSADTGMIGIPTRNQGFVEFQSLINPRLAPDQLVQLISEANDSLNGFYKILESHFEGDTHDQKWQVTCKCSLQDGVVQTLRAANGFDASQAVV